MKWRATAFAGGTSGSLSLKALPAILLFGRTFHISKRASHMPPPRSSMLEFTSPGGAEADVSTSRRRDHPRTFGGPMGKRVIVIERGGDPVDWASPEVRFRGRSRTYRQSGETTDKEQASIA